LPLRDRSSRLAKLLSARMVQALVAKATQV
jgi:hypothetical protein